MNTLLEYIKKNIYIFIIFPALIALMYVIFFGINVPYKDQWVIVPKLLNNYYLKTLTVNDLVNHHNEHIIFFPKILMFILAIFTRFNTVAEMIFIQLLFFIAFIIIYIQYKKSFDWKASCLYFIPIAFLIYNLRQWENMLLGVQICYLLVYSSALFSFYALYNFCEQKGMKWFVLSVIGGTVSTFSLSNGLFVWPSGFLQFLMASNFTIKKKKVFLIVWSAIGAAEWLLYFSLINLETDNKLYNLLIEPIAYIKFFLSILGNSVTGRYEILLVSSGIFLLLISLSIIILAIKSGSLACNQFWITAIIFSLLSISAITVSRVHFGYQASLASRYTTFSLLIIISLYVISIDLYMQYKNRLTKLINAALIIIIILNIPFSYARGLVLGYNHKQKLLESINSLKQYETGSNESLSYLYPDPNVVKRWAPFLQNIKYTVFKD